MKLDGLDPMALPAVTSMVVTPSSTVWKDPAEVSVVLVPVVVGELVEVTGGRRAVVSSTVMVVTLTC